MGIAEPLGVGPNMRGDEKREAEVVAILHTFAVRVDGGWVTFTTNWNTKPPKRYKVER